MFSIETSGKSRDPKHDLLKLWVGDEGDILMNFPTELQNLEKNRDQLLGPLDALHGGEKGGTALEPQWLWTRQCSRGSLPDLWSVCGSSEGHRSSCGQYESSSSKGG